MNKKADMWAFNFLAAVGIISIVFFGFFLLMYMVAPGDISKVKAAVDELHTGSQLINFFRANINDDLLVADMPNDCSKLERVFDSFYEKKVDYKVAVNGVARCVRGEPDDSAVTLDVVLPDYQGSVYNVTVEVMS